MREDRSILDAITQESAIWTMSWDRTIDIALARIIWTTFAEIERRIQRSEKQAANNPNVPDAPVGIPESYEEHVKLMFESAGAGLPGRHHARIHVHDGARAEPADESASERARSAPHATIASSERTRKKIRS